MTIKTASPQDTFDHMLGSGALSYSWWQGYRLVGQGDDWAAQLTCEDGNGGRVTKTVDHAAVLMAARKVIDRPPNYASQSLVRQCRNLIFKADETDFDAPVADELLQVTMLGEVVFG